MLEIIQRLREKAGLGFYLRPQTYEVSLEVVLANICMFSRDYAVLVPLPRESRNQRITKGPEIFPKTVSIQYDREFNNPYVVFTGNSVSKESFIFRVNFEVAVDRSEVRRRQTFITSDYARLDRALFDQWTASSEHIDIRDTRIISLANEVKKGASDVYGVLANINEYIISHLRYGEPIAGLYSVDQTLTKTVVDCGGFDVLFIALARACGIPARLVSGYWAGYGTNTMHAWAEALLPDGEWLPADPSVEQLTRGGRTLKGGRLGFIGSNRLIFSYGTDIPIVVDGKTMTLPLLQNPVLVFPETLEDFSLTYTVKTKRL
ncbi:MAG: transglutaminase-like domain-containing protein [Patescibacteria group bacterium]